MDTERESFGLYPDGYRIEGVAAYPGTWRRCLRGFVPDGLRLAPKATINPPGTRPGDFRLNIASFGESGENKRTNDILKIDIMMRGKEAILKYGPKYDADTDAFTHVHGSLGEPLPLRNKAARGEGFEKRMGESASSKASEMYHEKSEEVTKTNIQLKRKTRRTRPTNPQSWIPTTLICTVSISLERFAGKLANPKRRRRS